MSRLRGIAIFAALAAAAVVSDACRGRVEGAPHIGPAPILVLVSFDGWRWDYIDRFPTPNLRALAARGARAERLVRKTGNHICAGKNQLQLAKARRRRS